MHVRARWCHLGASSCSPFANSSADPGMEPPTGDSDLTALGATVWLLHRQGFRSNASVPAQFSRTSVVPHALMLRSSSPTICSVVSLAFVFTPIVRRPYRAHIFTGLTKQVIPLAFTRSVDR